MPSAIDLAVVASGTLGDILPVARLVSSLPDSTKVAVISNSRYFDLLRKPNVSYHEIPFDPGEMIASRHGQMMISGGGLGLNRIIGMRGVVHPQIRSVLDVAVPVLRRSRSMLVSGVPFGTAQVASALGIPVLRLLYQPHWPSPEIKSLYINSPVQLPPILCGLSHSLTNSVGRLLFRREVKRSLSSHFSDVPEAFTQLGVFGHLIHESFYFGHRTVFSISEPFAHEVARTNSEAVISGFIRPAQLAGSNEFERFVSSLAGENRPIVYCGFGSMSSDRAAATLVAATKAIQKVGAIAVVQVGDRYRHLLPEGARVAPFGDHRNLFQQCDAVIHHGGAGTLVASLDSGKPSCIVPQWADQFFWASRTYELGVSVKPPRDPLSPSQWESVLDELLRIDSHDYRALAASVVGSDGFATALRELKRVVDQ